MRKIDNMVLHVADNVISRPLLEQAYSWCISSSGPRVITVTLKRQQQARQSGYGLAHPVDVDTVGGGCN